IGNKIHASLALSATILTRSPLSPRLLRVRFDQEPSQIWRELYRLGRPIQYSYLRENLALWSVQTTYASRPWAAEMPSAGYPLTSRILNKLQQRGIRAVTLTHSTGLSATGDPA